MNIVSRLIVLCFVVGLVVGCVTTSPSTVAPAEIEPIEREVVWIEDPVVLLSAELESFFRTEILTKIFRGSWNDFKAEVVGAVYHLYTPEVETRDFLLAVLVNERAQEIFCRCLGESYPNISEDDRTALTRQMGEVYAERVGEMPDKLIARLQNRLEDLVRQYESLQSPSIVGDD